MGGAPARVRVHRALQPATDRRAELDELTRLGVERTSLGAGLSEREPEQRDRGRHRQLEEVGGADEGARSGHR